MEKRIKIIEHQGKKIHFIDYSGLKDEKSLIAIIELVDEFNKIQIEKKETDFLILSDITNSFIYGDALKIMKESGNKIKPYTKKTALLGITGAKKVLLRTANAVLNLNMRPFNSKEEALDWLVKD